MTMNNLPYPYTADKPDDLLEEKEYKQRELGAFNSRVKLLKLTNSFANNDAFPITAGEFAHILLEMYEKFDTIQKPNVPTKKIMLDNNLQPSVHLN